MSYSRADVRSATPRTIHRRAARSAASTGPNGHGPHRRSAERAEQERSRRLAVGSETDARCWQRPSRLGHSTHVGGKEDSLLDVICSLRRAFPPV